jgi:hypothetical protein
MTKTNDVWLQGFAVIEKGKSVLSTVRLFQEKEAAEWFLTEKGEGFEIQPVSITAN